MNNDISDDCGDHDPCVAVGGAVTNGEKGRLGQHHVARVQRVGVFNFGTDRVRVLEKTSGSGSGMDRVRVLAPCFLSIGYYRVFKILIGYFLVTSLKVFSFGST